MTKDTQIKAHDPNWKRAEKNKRAAKNYLHPEEKYVLIIFRSEPIYLPISVNSNDNNIKIIYKFINKQRRRNRINSLEPGTIYRLAYLEKNKLNYELK